LNQAFVSVAALAALAALGAMGTRSSVDLRRSDVKKGLFFRGVSALPFGHDIRRCGN